MLLLTFCLFLAVVAVSLTAGRRPWDAAHLALAPILVTVSFLNYDLLAIALLAVALLAWSRRHPVWAGMSLALAVGTRPVYLVLLVAVLALAARTGRWRHPLLLTATTLGLGWRCDWCCCPGSPAA